MYEKVKVITYTVEEATEAGMTWVQWRDADIGKVFVEDDFGNVGWLKRIQRYSIKDGKETTVKYTFAKGVFFYHPSHPTKKLSLNALHTPETIKGRVYKSPTKADKLRALAYIYARTWDKTAAIDIVSGGGMTKSQHTRWRRMFKTEEFKPVLKEELDALLDDSGLSKKDTLDLLKQVRDWAREGDNPDLKVLMSIITLLVDMHGMKDKNIVKTTATLEGSNTMKLVAKAGEEERHLKLQLTETSEAEVADAD